MKKLKKYSTKELGGQLEIYASGGPTPEKALSIIQAGQVYGKPLSSRQREFFANLAGTDEDGNPLDEETGEPIQDLGEDTETEYKYGGSMKRIDIPEGPLHYIFALGGENGIFKANTNFEDTDTIKNLNKFVKHITTAKYGGDCVSPSANVDDVVAQKKNMFSQFLQKNTMNALAEQEAVDLMHAHDLIKQFGGMPKMLTGGEDYTEPAGPETALQHAFRMRKLMEATMQPVPQQSNQVQISTTEAKNPYDFSANNFGQTTPQNPYQTQNTTMTGVQAPIVTPSTSETMDNMTEFPAIDSKPVQRSQSSQGGGGGFTISGEAIASGMINTMDGITSLLNRGEYNDRKEFYKQRMTADGVFQPVTGSDDRGTYDTNSGAFRPDSMVPQQFKGNTFGTKGSRTRYQEGGEYEMSDEEIEEIKRLGGTIEYLD